MDKRFFIENLYYNVNDKIIIDGEEHKHLSLVLRLKVGDTISCLPNDNRVVTAKIVSIDKNKTTAIVEKIVIKENSVKNVDVFAGNMKSDKNEFVIQKLSELGVNKISFFENEFVTAKFVKDKGDRYEKIALTSAKQCKRNKSIEIGENLSFNQLVVELKKYDLVLVAYENEKTVSLNDYAFDLNKKIALVVGSEGGFSEKEIELLKQNSMPAISLGKRILKAETACVVFASLVMFRLGELG